MVNFLSSFLPNLHRLLIPIYDLQKKAKKLQWTEEAERAFNDIKKLLISGPPKPKSQISSSNPRTPTAAKNTTI